MLNPILFQIGPFAIRWYGVMYILGISSGFAFVWAELKTRFGLSSDQLYSLVTTVMLGIFIGGRVGYVVIYDFAYYAAHPLEIFQYWHGGMSYHGGALGCALAFGWFSVKHRLPVWALLDYLGIGSTFGLGLGRIGNFINGELYGRVTTMPWGVVFPDGGLLPRHPSQLYQSLTEGLLLFLILWSLKKRVNLKEGQLFAAYLMGYGVFRFCTEFFREPDAQLGFVVANLSMGQVLCLGMVIMGTVLWWKKKAPIPNPFP